MPAHRSLCRYLEASGAVAYDPQRFHERQPEPKSEEALGNPPTGYQHEMSHIKLHPYRKHGKKFNAEMLRLAEAGAFNDLW